MLSCCNWQSHLMGAHHASYIPNNGIYCTHTETLFNSDLKIDITWFDLCLSALWSSPREASSHTDHQECLCLLWNPEVHSCWPLAWARKFRFTPKHPVSLTSLSVLSSLLCMCLWSGLIPLGSPTGILYTFHSVSHVCYLHHPSHSQWYCCANKRW